MNQLSEKERQYAYLAAALAAAVCLVFAVANVGTPAALAVSGLGVVTAGLLAIGARRGNRLSSGVGAALLALGPSPAWVVGLPYLMLFGWFTLQASRRRVKQEPEVELDENGEIVTRTVQRPARQPRPARAPRRRRRGSGGEDVVATGPDGLPVRKPPPASKRYTPPQRPR